MNNDTIPAVLRVLLVSTGVLAELNLLRLFVRERREERVGELRRRLRTGVTRAGRSEAGGRGVGRRLRPAAASLICWVIPSAALAQEGAAAPVFPPASGGAIPAPEHLKPGEHVSITLEPAVATEGEGAPLVISADRPGFSEGAGIVPTGHLQLETGYTFTFRNRDDVETQRHNAPELLARFGLLEDRLEVRLSTSGYVWSRTDDGSGAGFVSSEGFSDLALGVKVKLADQDGWLPRLALDAASTLGVGSDNISSQTAEPTLKLLWAYDLGRSFGDGWNGITLGGNAVIAWPTTDGDRFTQGQGSVYLSLPIADRVSGFAEYYVIGPNSKGGDAAHYVDFGGAYLLNNRTQLDARVGFGLNEEADNMFLGVGISILF